MKNKKINIEVPSDLRFSHSLRNFVGDILQIINVNNVWKNRLILVIDELFMNSVRYGSAGDNDTVYFTIAIDEEKVIFTIEDEGKGTKIDPKKLKAIVEKNKNDHTLIKTSGRGLSLIVNNWADKLNFSNSEHGGLKLEMIKFLDKIVDSEERSESAHIHHEENIQRIHFAKHFDVHNGDDEKNLIKFVTESDKHNYIFDLEKIQYINSVFIGLIAKIYNIISKRNGKAVIVNASEKILDPLKAVGLVDIIPVVSSLEEAKKILNE